MEENEPNLRQKIDQIYKKLGDADIPEPNKEKKFKFKLGKGRLSKKNIKDGYVTVLYIHNNLHAEFMKKQIIQNTIKIDDYHEATTEDIVMHKNKPLIIVCEWNEKPFNGRRDYEDAAQAKTLTYGQKYILNRMKSDLIKPKNPISGMTIIWIIVALVGGYILYTQFLHK